MIQALLFVLEYWWVIGGICLAGAITIFGWRKIGLAVFLLTFGAALYREGQKNAQADRRKRDKAMEERLKNEYAEIDHRGIDRGGVVERLRDGKF